MSGMKLFDLQNGKLSTVKSLEFQLEREIQELVEANVEQLFGLQLVKSEFYLGRKRFDSLCFDEETNSFVIIEYKRGSNKSIIDQGFTYLSLLLNNKAEVVLEYNENNSTPLKRKDVEWSQSKIIFISQQFNDFQRMSVNFKNIPFELYEVKRFERDIIGLSEIQSDSKVELTTPGLNTSKMKGDQGAIEEVTSQLSRYTEEYHLQDPKKSKQTPQWVKELYYRLKETIFELHSDIEMKIKKMTIGFKLGKTVCDIKIQDKGIYLAINLNKGELKDELKKCKDMSDKGHHGLGDYVFNLKSEDDLSYARYLLKQSLNKRINDQ